jgi:hypothetical protein
MNKFAKIGETADPYEQRGAMRSVDPSGLVRAVSGAERCT